MIEKIKEEVLRELYEADKKAILLVVPKFEDRGKIDIHKLIDFTVSKTAKAIFDDLKKGDWGADNLKHDKDKDSQSVYKNWVELKKKWCEK